MRSATAVLNGFWIVNVCGIEARMMPKPSPHDRAEDSEDVLMAQAIALSLQQPEGAQLTQSSHRDTIQVPDMIGVIEHFKATGALADTKKKTVGNDCYIIAFTTMMTQNENSKDVKIALEMLMKIVCNIVDNPYEKKYKVIKRTSKGLNAKVLNLRGGLEALIGVGFKADGDCYRFQESFATVLPNIMDSMKYYKALALLKQEMGTAVARQDFEYAKWIQDKITNLQELVKLRQQATVRHDFELAGQVKQRLQDFTDPNGFERQQDETVRFLYDNLKKAREKNEYVDAVKFQMIHEYQNIIDSNQCTALTYAASEYKGHLEIVRHLGDSGFDLASSDKIGWNVLTHAAAYGHLEIIKYAETKGYDINSNSGNGTTPLTAAAQGGQLDIVKYLESRGSNLIANDNGRQTALTRAARNNHLHIIRYLDSREIDLTANDKNGFTAVTLAAAAGHLEIIEYLHSKGADLKTSNKKGSTAATQAAGQGHLHIIEYLHAKGLDLTAHDNFGFTPLTMAAYEGHLNIIQYFDQNDMDLTVADATVLNRTGNTAFSMACAQDHKHILNYLEKVKQPVSLENLPSISTIASEELKTGDRVEFINPIEGQIGVVGTIRRVLHREEVNRFGYSGSLEIFYKISGEDRDGNFNPSDVKKFVDPDIIGNYTIRSILGQGGFGVVKKVHRTDDPNIKYAMKEWIASKDDEEKAKREATILQQLRHRNIVRYIDSFNFRNAFYWVMELADGGDLHQQIASQKNIGSPFQEHVIKDWFHQVLHGLTYLHHEKVIHRDLKPKNILLFKQNTGPAILKIADFGLSKVMDGSTEHARTVCGTRIYMSPETLDGKAYTFSSDVWALGCVLYEICVLYPAFHNASGVLTKPIPTISGESDGGQDLSVFCDLCSKMLVRTPENRPNCDQLIIQVSQWFTATQNEENNESHVSIVEDSVNQSSGPDVGEDGFPTMRGGSRSSSEDER